MTLNDLPAFVASWDRMARLAIMRADEQARSDWWEALQRYPLYAVEQALSDCHRAAGRFKPTLGVVEDLAVKACADREGAVRSTESRTRYYRDGDGVLQAEYECHVCGDLGWMAKANGQVVIAAELQRRGVLPPSNQEHLSTSHYALAPCGCREKGRAA